jgi:hypothetical protein
LLEVREQSKVELLRSVLEEISSIAVTALRPPALRDRLALRHGLFVMCEEIENMK